MKLGKKLMVLCLTMGFLLSGCSNSPQTVDAVQGEGAEVQVFAAASLTNCLDEIIASYQAQSNHHIVAVYEASGTLREQIEAGADCDIFLSANQKHMDILEEEGVIDPASRKNLLGNDLTLIASADKENIVTDVQSLLQDEIAYVVIGEPSEVPAGEYAQEMLEHLGIWEDIQDKLVFAKNVRSVLTYVDGGDADCGLVYHTDALELKNGVIIGNAPEGSYTAVNYPSAILKEAPQMEAAADFYAYLSSDTAKAIFEQYGFTVL